MAESEPDSPPDLERLLRHGSFVRALARRLAEQESDAAEIEQQAWLAALSRPPATDAAIRSWFGTVARNVLLQSVRARGRRRRRERASARPEIAGAPEDALIAEERRREVLTQMLALDPPHRDVILLRFFEDLGPTEIAARMGIPLETVRTRLRRALERLRARLA